MRSFNIGAYLYQLKSTVLCILVSGLSITSVCSQSNSWQQLLQEDIDFSVMTPCELIHKEKELNTDIGDIAIHSYHCTSDAIDPNELYLVTYTDYEKGSFEKDSIELLELFYQESLGQITEDLGGTLYYSSAHTINGLSGVLARIGYNQETAICKLFITMIDDRFYAVQVFSKVEKSLNEETDQFLNSFRVISQ